MNKGWDKLWKSLIEGVFILTFLYFICTLIQGYKCKNQRAECFCFVRYYEKASRR